MIHYAQTQVGTSPSMCTQGLSPATSAPGTGLAAATSAPGLGSYPPHLRRDSAHPSHICTWTRLTPPTSAPGLGSPLPHLHLDSAHPSHICIGTGLTPARAATGRPCFSNLLHRSIVQYHVLPSTASYLSPPTVHTPSCCIGLGSSHGLRSTTETLPSALAPGEKSRAPRTVRPARKHTG